MNSPQINKIKELKQISFYSTFNDILSNKCDSYIEENTLPNDFSFLSNFYRFEKSFEKNRHGISANNDKTSPNFINKCFSFDRNDYNINQSISLDTTKNDLSKIFKSSSLSN